MARSKAQAGGPTLAHVAAAAGVSLITASRAIRGQGPMTAATRARVLRAVEETGYRPNPIAASLVSASSSLIGVVVPSLANIVFVDVLNGLNSAVSPQGLRTTIAVSEYDAAEELRLVESLLAWKPAALVLTGVEHEAGTVRRIRSSGVRCIEIMDLTEAPIDLAIGFSHEEAGRLSARHLVRRGYRRFGYVGHDMRRDRRSAKRYEGFRAGLREAGQALGAEMVTAGPSGVAAGRRAMAALLDRAPRPEAVYFSNDDMAIGGLFHCCAAAVAVPDEVAVMGFNGLDIGQQLPRPLTTIRTPRFEIGRRAGLAALDLASGRDVAAVQAVGFDLIDGETA